MHIRMSHFLVVGHSDGESKGCCLGGLSHINNTLKVCTTLLQHHSISLLYEHSYTVEVLKVKPGLQ